MCIFSSSHRVNRQRHCNILLSINPTRSAKIALLFLATILFFPSTFALDKNQPSSAEWISPINGFYVVSPFQDPNRHQQDKHKGIDVLATKSTRLLAPAPGLVILSTEQDSIYTSHENVIVIDHGDDILTLYGELKERKVKVGQWVQAGQTIGSVQDGSDLNEEHYTHIEVIYHGKSIDPFIKLPYRFFDLELAPRGFPPNYD